MCIMKMNRVVMRTIKHVKQTLISAKQYLRDQTAKHDDHYKYRDNIYR